MDSLKYCFFCIAALILVISIREFENRFALFIRMAVSVCITTVCASMFATVFEYINNNALTVSIGEETAEIFSSMLKMTGISFIGCISASMCRDCGENGLASLLESVCKLEIIILCLPIIDSIVDKIQSILG